MLNNNIVQKGLGSHIGSRGFTIIEVLIVLAIAGLIMLIVFLAVPALQRNSRNTSRRSDVSRILGAVQEVSSNSGNQINTTVITATKVKAAAGSLGYYSDVTAVNGAPSAAVNDTTADTVKVYLGSTCDSAGKAIAATARQIAVVYSVEPGTTNQCTNS